MTTSDTTEDFTAASADAEDGSARWARRLPLRLPSRLPLRLPLRRGRSLETGPFDPEAAHTVDTLAPATGGHVEPTHRLAGFELRSVASTALVYYACVFVVLTLGVVLVWGGANLLGVVGRVEAFMRSIGFRGFHFAGFDIIVGGVLLCVAAVAFLTVMTVLAAAFYNLLGRPDRGVKLRLEPIEPVTVAEASSPHTGNGNNGHSNGSNGHSNGTEGGTGTEGEGTRARRFFRFRILVGRRSLQ